MTQVFRCSLIALLVAGMAAAGCNDDEPPTTPTGPQDNEQPGPGDNGGGMTAEDERAAAFFAELSQTMTGVVGLLLIGGGELDGAGGGQVVVDGTTLSFEDYSPDGETTMNGVIEIAVEEGQWNITGSLVLSGGSEGDVVVNMTLDPLTSPPAPEGTVTIDGTEYDVAALAAQNANG